jgi:hypothetical protein
VEEVSAEGGGASRSTDPAAGTSSATDVSLREYLTTLIEASRRECRDNVDSLRAQMRASDRARAEAIEKALLSIDKRFENVNEFRAALNDLSKRMATQESLHGIVEKFEAAMEGLEVRFEALYQRNRDDITAIVKRLDLREGQSVGSRLTTTTLVTTVTVAIALLGLIIVLANYFSSH